MHDQITILKTERLRLKRLELADVSALIDLWCDPDVTKHMGGPRDRTKLENILKEDVKDPFSERFDLWPVEETQSEKIIGHCGLLDKEVDGKTEIELIYVFSPTVWGRGYATEIGQALKQYAFEEMGIKRLIALIDPENAASEQVAVNIGMQFEKEVIRSAEVKRKVYVVENP